MAEIINLRQARKRAARKNTEIAADANRALHSIPARVRRAAAKTSKLDQLRHEANRLELPGHEPAQQTDTE